MSEVLIIALAVLELIDVSLDITLTISEFHQNRRLQREGNSTLHQGDQVGLPSRTFSERVLSGPPRPRLLIKLLSAGRSAALVLYDTAQKIIHSARAFFGS
ncbi:hypothetical protein TWF970_002018 [Orbilia oligospora]|uniref:Uncharacterized protein n=1 Tax=Orbilia oligospora TaxID=2813651 RepID=A0A7C8RIY6_ORBOL|nr:hypothetical protein TWF970_002018 [Orbilia oligospora]